MAEGINVLESRCINGVEQWLLLQSDDIGLPVLLILHGGPGYAMMPLFHDRNTALEKEFVVVNWDQRGAGRSFNRKIPKRSMTLRAFLDDLGEVTRYLKERFGREKIYILGHSYGTVLGLLAAQEHPEDYQAFIGVGQVIGPIINEITMYDAILRFAEEDGNEKAIKKLKRIGRPDCQGQYHPSKPVKGDPYDIADHWMEYYGGDLYKKHSSSEIDDWLMDQPEYHGRWGRKWENGLKFSQKLFDDPEAWEIDFRTRDKKVDIPLFFLQGHHDYDTPWTLVRDFVPTLVAPVKELVWFDNSAHFPFYEESERFNEVMVSVVKGVTS